MGTSTNQLARRLVGLAAAVAAFGPIVAGTAAVASTEVPATGFAAIGPVVQQFVDTNGLNGAGLVVFDRETGIVHEEYWGEFDADHVSFIASSTKPITTGVLMRLAEDGLLDLDAPVAEYVEWGRGNPDITAAQLMSHTSGLVGLGPDPTYPPYLCQFLPDQEIEACAETVFTTPDDDADVVPPDTEFRYGGAQWQVAGALAEAVSGRTWAELVEETYVEPCGLDSLGYNNHWILTGGFDYPYDVDPTSLEPTENPHMEGGAFITATDYAEFLLMHLRDGECANGQVLSPESVERWHTDRLVDVFPEGIEGEDTGYGLGWWVDRETGRVSSNGAYGTVAWLDLDEGYGASLVIESSYDVGAQLSDSIEPLIDEAMTASGSGG